jgi:hypothetical protein
MAGRLGVTLEDSRQQADLARPAGLPNRSRHTAFVSGRTTVLETYFVWWSKQFQRSDRGCCAERPSIPKCSAHELLSNVRPQGYPTQIDVGAEELCDLRRINAKRRAELPVISPERCQGERASPLASDHGPRQTLKQFNEVENRFGRNNCPRFPTRAWAFAAVLTRHHSLQLELRNRNAEK